MCWFLFVEQMVHWQSVVVGWIKCVWRRDGQEEADGFLTVESTDGVVAVPVSRLSGLQQAAELSFSLLEL